MQVQALFFINSVEVSHLHPLYGSEVAVEEAVPEDGASPVV
jgi:hypothetical protein